jgi:hypothetical protein
MNIDNLKFCKDCKYLSVSHSTSTGKCLHPASLKLVDFLVDGDAGNREHYEYAIVMRIREQTIGPQPGCGAVGRHFMQKPIAIENAAKLSRWKKLLRLSNK